ncbi:MAG: AMP-binding protein [Cyanobacteriota bacterium]
MALPAEIHWSNPELDRQAQARRHDWSALQGLDQLWPELERQYGDAVALVAPHDTEDKETVSFSALRQRIDQAAAGFAALGLGGGEVVALFAENGPRWLVADQGLMRCGAANAVRGSSAPVEELRYILADSGSVGLVVESAALLARLGLDGEACQRLRFVVLLEGEAPSAPDPAHLPCLSWASFMAQGAAAPLPAAPSGGAGRLATLLYTSGTTGEPKGVPLSHGNLLHQVRNLGALVDPKPGDEVLSVLPIWHAYERSVEYFLLSCGCRQTYTTLRHFKNDLQRVRPHYMVSVPRLWEAILSGFEDALATMPPGRQRLLRAALANSRAFHTARRTALDLTLTPEAPATRQRARVESLARWPAEALAAAQLWPKLRQQLVGGRLRTAISGGGALAPYVDGFFEAVGIELLVGYGLTETSPVLTCRRQWANRRGSAGQPLAETSLRIVDPESRRTLAIGERGLVLARGPQVMAGYWGKPEATAKVLDGQGWFDTGDLGLLLADGTLVLTGRAKDTIVLSSGENIEPGPLEDALAALPMVEQVMVVGQDRRQLGLLLVPKAEALAAWALAQGLPVAKGSEVGAAGPPSADPLPADPALLKALNREFNRVLAARAGSRPDERLAGVAVVAPFTIENGLLTQTLKQRRDRIAQRDAAAIEGLYS